MRSGVVTGLAVCLVSAGCYTARAVTIPQPGAMPAMQTERGVTVGADPYVEPERQKLVFDHNLHEKGVIPIQVLIQNREGKRLLLRTAAITLTLPDGRDLISTTPEVVEFWIQGGFGEAGGGGLGFPDPLTVVANAVAAVVMVVAAIPAARTSADRLQDYRDQGVARPHAREGSRSGGLPLLCTATGDASVRGRGTDRPACGSRRSQATRGTPSANGAEIPAALRALSVRPPLGGAAVLIGSLAGGLLAVPLAAGAQQPGRVYRSCIRIISAGSRQLAALGVITSGGTKGLTAMVLVALVAGCGGLGMVDHATTHAALSFLEDGKTSKAEIFERLSPHAYWASDDGRLVTYKMTLASGAARPVTRDAESDYELVLVFDGNDTLTRHSLIKVR